MFDPSRPAELGAGYPEAGLLVLRSTFCGLIWRVGTDVGYLMDGCAARIKDVEELALDDQGCEVFYPNVQQSSVSGSV
jgi:hypothetical protein